MVGVFELYQRHQKKKLHHNLLSVDYIACTRQKSLFRTAFSKMGHGEGGTYPVACSVSKSLGGKGQVGSAQARYLSVTILDGLI